MATTFVVTTFWRRGWRSRLLPVADERRRRKGKLRADKRGFSPSPYATITFQGRDLFKSPNTIIVNKKSGHYFRSNHFLAERGGFEPPVRNYRTPAFQASTLNHSDISPCFNAHSVYHRFCVLSTLFYKKFLKIFQRFLMVKFLSSLLCNFIGINSVVKSICATWLYVNG